MTSNDVLAASDDGWQVQARCAGRYPAAFFPAAEHERPEDRALRESVARAICRDCAVVQPCLDLAQALGDPDGVWGGMNQRQRRKHRARRALDLA